MSSASRKHKDTRGFTGVADVALEVRALLRNYARHRADRPVAVTASHHALFDLARLPADWNGHGAPPPSPAACALAFRVVDASLAAGAEPSRIVPDADGGVAVYWMSKDTLEGGAHRRLASVGVDNEGMIAASITDRAADTFRAWDITLDSLAQTVRTLLMFVGPERA
jgi:hypothetical protein